MIRSLVFVVALVAFASTLALAASGPPPTRVVSVTDTFFGTAVADPYRWLESDRSPQVSAWIDAQNKYADGVFARFKNQASINARLRQLALTGPQQFGAKVVAGTLFYLREVPPQPQPVLAVQAWPLGTLRTLVDTNPAGGLVSIEGYWPSPDGRYVAYATQEAGAEATTMHVVEVGSGRILPESLPRVGGGTSTDALAWDADSKGFVYTHVPAPGSVPKGQEFFNSVLFHHKLGSAASADALALGKGLSPVAEWNAMDSADGRAAALVHYGDGSYSNVYLREGGRWVKVVDASAGVLVGDDETRVITAAFVGDQLYVIETTGHPRGEIVAIDPHGKSHTVLAQDDWAVRGIFAIRGGFLTREVWGPAWRVRQFTAAGKLVRTVALPSNGISVDAVAAEPSSSAALIEYSGWTTPERWVRYDAQSGALTTLYQLKPAADYSNVAFTVEYAVSRDGTRVPFTVIHKRGAAANATAPGLLTAYGGYGLEQGPFFIGSALFWIERGGVYIDANIRGGGELGEAWHLGGNLTHKQNDYDDFAAVAQQAISSGWVAPGRLGIVGGSNGGLLMGAALTQHPELYRAVASFAGIYDMLRVELTPNGRYNVSEYGTVQNKTLFDALYGYSPYHHVTAGTKYPAVMMVTGENDPRVAPWQSRKMIARLQAANAGGNPIVLLTRRAAGHGIGASFSQRLGDRSAQYIFFANELGLPMK
jgi:prolyl oligopeptidase